MTSLFAKPPEPPPVQKVPDYEGIRRSERRKAAARKNSGRASTVLTDQKLGGS